MLMFGSRCSRTYLRHIGLRGLRYVNEPFPPLQKKWIRSDSDHLRYHSPPRSHFVFLVLFFNSFRVDVVAVLTTSWRCSWASSSSSWPAINDSFVFAPRRTRGGFFFFFLSAKAPALHSFADRKSRQTQKKKSGPSLRGPGLIAARFLLNGLVAMSRVSSCFTDGPVRRISRQPKSNFLFAKPKIVLAERGEGARYKSADARETRNPFKSPIV